MYNKLTRLFEPGFWLALAALVFFSILALRHSYQIAGAMILVSLLLLVFYVQYTKVRRKQIIQYVELLSGRISDAAIDSQAVFPLPCVVVEAASGEIIWFNDSFSAIMDEKEEMHERNINKLMPNFDTSWVIEGESVYPSTVMIGEKHYKVYGNLSSSEGAKKTASILLTMYWVDSTEYVNMKEEFRRTRNVTGIVTIDNYDELVKNISDAEKSKVLADIDEYVGEWYRRSEGIWRRYDRDKYIVLFEEGWLQEFISEKFNVLDRVRTIQSSSGVTATLSIGLGRDGKSLAENFNFANLALEMALSRGGDQVVVRHKYAFDFYGGVSKELEKQTKVKSRVVANALGQLIRDSSQVFIMGHKLSDYDAIGAAIGVACAVRSKDKTPYIVVDRETTLAHSFIEKMEVLEEYQNTFISPEEAIIMADGNTLLVVVDTNRPDYVESPELLDSINKVAVIDHHRRAANYIENSAVSMHEPYASSASELVVELLQYFVYNQKILTEEAECLLGGIYLDTKGFTNKAGVRTFEAAAYLRRAGADMARVKREFQVGFEDFKIKQQIIADAEYAGEGFVIAVTDQEVDRIIAGQAADELLDVTDVSASFVVYGNEGGAIISARSEGEVNVQVIMEKLGGGGSLASAGAQLSGESLESASSRLLEAIEEYRESI